jgi:hypothetical protein
MAVKKGFGARGAEGWWFVVLYKSGAVEKGGLFTVGLNRGCYEQHDR